MVVIAPNLAARMEECGQKLKDDPIVKAVQGLPGYEAWSANVQSQFVDSTSSPEESSNNNNKKK